MNWYENGAKYWESTEASVCGVLGGYPDVHEIDVAGSRKILDYLKTQKLISFNHVCDCGAGIGRVSKILSEYFEKIDLVEQNIHFLEEAKKQIKGNFILSSLTEFDPTVVYDLVWCQWVLEYLIEKDVVELLKRLRQKTKFVVVKENIVSKNIKNSIDSSEMRTVHKWESLFFKAGFKILKQDWQELPHDLCKVKIWILY